VWQAAWFSKNGQKIGNESRMECGRVKAKNLLEYTGNLAENPWKNISLCCWPPCILILQNTNELNISVTLILDLGMPTSRAMYFYSYVIFLPQGWVPREYQGIRNNDYNLHLVWGL